jgi:hypothetical protein
MRAVTKILLLPFVVALAGGLVVCIITYTRKAARMVQCQGGLRQIGLACQDHHGMHLHFPTGTVSGTALPPEKRLEIPRKR